MYIGHLDEHTREFALKNFLISNLLIPVESLLEITPLRSKPFSSFQVAFSNAEMAKKLYNPALFWLYRKTIP